jgi:hypothetical protein
VSPRISRKCDLCVLGSFATTCRDAHIFKLLNFHRFRRCFNLTRGLK